MKSSQESHLQQVPEAKRSSKRVLYWSIAIALPASVYLIFFALSKEGNISIHGYVAHAIAVILAFLSSFLFMGIMFFSARSGHDEQPNYRKIVEDQRQRETREKTGDI